MSQCYGLTTTQSHFAPNNYKTNVHDSNTFKNSLRNLCTSVTDYNKTQSQLEAIQKLVIRPIFNYSLGIPYSSMLLAAELNPLANLRERGISHAMSFSVLSAV